jgi:hypothetical protein
MGTTAEYFVTGEAIAAGNQDMGAFTLSFETPYDGRTMPDFFQDSIVPLNNYSLNVSGTLYSAPGGEFWGGFEMPGNPYFVSIWGNQDYKLENFVITQGALVQTPDASVPAPHDFIAIMLWCVAAYLGMRFFSTPPDSHPEPRRSP